MKPPEIMPGSVVPLPLELPTLPAARGWLFLCQLGISTNHSSCGRPPLIDVRPVLSQPICFYLNTRTSDSLFIHIYHVYRHLCHHFMDIY